MSDFNAPVGDSGPVDSGTVDTTVTAPPVAQPEASGDNPAWNEVLDILPSEFHPMVKPHLQKWDRGVQERFEKVQSQYSPYKPLVENQISPDEVSAALQMMNLMATNPRQVYDKLTEYYADEWGLSGQGQSADDGDDYGLDDIEGSPQIDIENNPYIQQIKEQQDTIAKFLASEVEAKEKARIDAEIDQQFKRVEQKHGELTQEDVNIIVSIATTQDIDVEKAAEVLFGRLGQVQKPNQGLPSIVPTGGGVPNAPINPAELSKQDTKSLVQSILRNAAQANQ